VQSIFYIAKDTLFTGENIFAFSFPKKTNYMKLKNSYWKNGGVGEAKAVVF